MGSIVRSLLRLKLRTGSELVKGCAPFPALRRFKRSKFKDRLGWGTSTFREFSKRQNERRSAALERLVIHQCYRRRNLVVIRQ